MSDFIAFFSNLAAEPPELDSPFYIIKNESIYIPARECGETHEATESSVVYPVLPDGGRYPAQAGSFLNWVFCVL